MNRETGLSIGTLEHIRQSIADILTTPIGSRVMRRDYGSLLPELIDQPLNGTGTVRLYAASAAALMRWEPRIKLSSVQISLGSEHGAVDMAVYGVHVDSNSQISMSVPLMMGASA